MGFPGFPRNKDRRISSSSTNIYCHSEDTLCLKVHPLVGWIDPLLNLHQSSVVKPGILPRSFLVLALVLIVDRNIYRSKTLGHHPGNARAAWLSSNTCPVYSPVNHVHFQAIQCIQGVDKS